MTFKRKPFRRLKGDEEGATILEFALILPVFLLLLLGTFEIGYAIYMRSALNGAVQLAAREASLQDAGDPAVLAGIDANVTAVLLAVNSAATVSTDNRKNYASFADVERMESYTDTDGNGICDNSEPFTDENGSGVWDNVGQAGLGGARDTVLYTITVSYDSVFPFEGFARGVENPNAPNQRVLRAQTLLKSQPFNEQTARVTAPGNCT